METRSSCGMSMAVWAGFVFATLISVACGPRPQGAAEEDHLVSLVNRGVGLMGRYEYGLAIEVFEQAALDEPSNAEVRVNLAIAVLNRQQENDEQYALDLLGEVLVEEPANLRALYCIALLELRRGDAAAAADRLAVVVENSSEDADAAYWLGQSLMALDRIDEAVSWFERAAELDPYLRSASYGTFQARQRLGQRELGMKDLERFQALAENPRARLAEYKYTRMGSKATAAPLQRAISTELPTAPAGPVFADPSFVGVDFEWADEAVSKVPTVCDLNGDAIVDLFLPAVADSASGGANLVLMGQGDGSFGHDPGHPLSSVSEVRTALWGDLDNDGLTDAYLCRRGPNQLWRQEAGGEWQDVTESTGTGGGAADTVDGALWDADHDGDLDLFLVNADSPNELLNNNGDGTFRHLAEERGLTGLGLGSRRVIVADLDGDRDTDIVVVNEQTPHEVYHNDLLWQWLPAEGLSAFQESGATEVVAADTNADGRVDLVSLERDGAVRIWERSDGEWQAQTLLGAGRVVGEGAQLAVADLDGDSQLDVIVSHRNGWTAVRLDGSELAQGTAEGLAGWTVAAIEPSRGPSIVGWSPEKGPMVWAPGSGRWPFVAMSLSGREDRADSMRSNASGIGSRVVARIADRWAVHEGIRWVSGPGQSLQPIQIGLGKAEYVDYAEIHWSDGVYQSELELAAGEMHRFTETQRQLSSCPVLFAWNGQRWEFVTDLLGVGGMGYAVAPGEYAPPRPWENILFKEGALVPRAGRLAVKLSEPMEEVTYLDAARLVAWDLPPEWSMVLDERMGILGPEPTGRPLFYRNERAPEIARDGAGNDVTALVARADLQAPSVGSVDYRYIGLLEGEQLLELSFLEPLDGFGNRLALVVDGWVEYPYSQTNFAAWQAGKTYQAPTLEARGDDGQWHVVLEQWGYPAGMPRRMAVPLPTLPKGTRELRLRTNQEIYWDRVVVARVERCPKAKKQVLTMAEARLSATGYARRSTGDQRVPDYDYARRSPLWDTKVQEGWYTRFGAVDALVVDSDDAFAVFGPGEEVHLEFLAPQKGPADGWQRWWVLETEGWCKDMDLYTKDGATVEPLPAGHRGRKHVAGRQLHEAFATRYRSGLE